MVTTSRRQIKPTTKKATRPMAKNYIIEVTNADALMAEHPDAIKQVTVIKHVKDDTRLYELASAAFTLGKPLPGVKITRKTDGKVLMNESEGTIAAGQGGGDAA